MLTIDVIESIISRLGEAKEKSVVADHTSFNLGVETMESNVIALLYRMLNEQEGIK